jgi:acyl-CoA thioester hydrolase
MPEMTNHSSAHSLQQFLSISTDKLRYGDTDRQGHVNNAVFMTFLETGRVEVLHRPNSPIYDDNAEFVLVNVNLNLQGEIRWPGEVQIGTAVSKIGNSSITFYQQVFQNEICVASAVSVVVQMNTMTRKPQPLSETARTSLSAFLLKPGED